MKYIVAFAIVIMVYATASTESSAQGWNQKAYNNSQAAQKSQQHYNRQTNRR